MIMIINYDDNNKLLMMTVISNVQNARHVNLGDFTPRTLLTVLLLSGFTIRFYQVDFFHKKFGVSAYS